MNLLDGGSKDSFYKFYLTTPSIVWSGVSHLKYGNLKIKKICLPIKFMLTSNKCYCNIEISILGFGLGLEIYSKNG